jgi:hypothetical protein
MFVTSFWLSGGQPLHAAELHSLELFCISEFGWRRNPGKKRSLVDREDVKSSPSCSRDESRSNSERSLELTQGANPFGVAKYHGTSLQMIESNYGPYIPESGLDPALLRALQRQQADRPAASNTGTFDDENRTLNRTPEAETARTLAVTGGYMMRGGGLEPTRRRLSEECEKACKSAWYKAKSTIRFSGKKRQQTAKRGAKMPAAGSRVRAASDLRMCLGRDRGGHHSATSRSLDRLSKARDAPRW